MLNLNFNHKVGLFLAALALVIGLFSVSHKTSFNNELNAVKQQYADSIQVLLDSVSVLNNDIELNLTQQEQYAKLIPFYRQALLSAKKLSEIAISAQDYTALLVQLGALQSDLEEYLPEAGYREVDSLANFGKDMLEQLFLFTSVIAEARFNHQNQRNYDGELNQIRQANHLEMANNARMLSNKIDRLETENRQLSQELSSPTNPCPNKGDKQKEWTAKMNKQVEIELARLKRVISIIDNGTLNRRQKLMHIRNLCDDIVNPTP